MPDAYWRQLRLKPRQKHRSPKTQDRRLYQTPSALSTPSKHFRRIAGVPARFGSGRSRSPPLVPALFSLSNSSAAPPFSTIKKNPLRCTPKRLHIPPKNLLPSHL